MNKLLGSEWQKNYTIFTNTCTPALSAPKILADANFSADSCHTWKWHNSDFLVGEKIICGPFRQP